MARTRTRAEMLAQARALSDQANSTNTDSTEVVVWLNQAITGLWDRLVRADAMRHARVCEMTTTSAVREYDFTDAAVFTPTADDFMSLVGVSYLQGPVSKEVPLEPFSIHERGFMDYDNQGPWPGAYARWSVRYQGQDGSDARLVFDRDPEPGPKYRLYYVRAAPELASDISVFDGINGWEDEAVYTVAILLMQREESDPSVLIQEREVIRQRIQAGAAKRKRRSSQVASVFDPTMHSDFNDFSNRRFW